MSPELKALIGEVHLTPSQLKLLEVLKDGKRHSRHDLRRLFETGEFPPELLKSVFKLLAYYVLSVRTKLPSDQAIVSEVWQGGYYYRWIKLLHPNIYVRNPTAGKPVKPRKSRKKNIS